MIILSIETSCDETAVSIVEATGGFPNTTYRVLGDALFSQIEIHREYGGVFPAVAKREHIAIILPMLKKALEQASLQPLPHATLFPEKEEEIKAILAREPGLADALITFYEKYNTPPIDRIAVTHGPGLEPALWVGINFAKALGALWNIPVVGINHMEGHIFASLFDGEHIAPLAFPAVALLISGGHTELVLMREWNSYELIGHTRDDAVGEAFDKVARTLGLSYPGGPEISKHAEAYRALGKTSALALPRPMINTDDCDFSFSGLKTSVLYHVKDRDISDEERQEIACAFEDAVTDVLIKKTFRAVDTHGAQSLILGGGVSANKHIRNAFTQKVADTYPHISLHLPTPKLTTDNSVMIALVAYAKKDEEINAHITANGNLSVSTER